MRKFEHVSRILSRILWFSRLFLRTKIEWNSEKALSQILVTESPYFICSPEKIHFFAFSHLNMFYRPSPLRLINLRVISNLSRCWFARTTCSEKFQIFRLNSNVFEHSKRGWKTFGFCLKNCGLSLPYVWNLVNLIFLTKENISFSKVWVKLRY